MNFEQLQSFYLIATLGSFQKAADYQYTTQPTISARIKILEQSMNTTLFNRDMYRAVLTSDGHRLLPYAEQILRLKEDIQVQISGINKTNNFYRFGASDSIANTCLPMLISDISQNHDEMRFDVVVAPSPQLLNDLLSHKIDIAFILTPPPNGALIVDHLCALEMVYAAAPNFNLHNKKLDYRDISDINILTFDKGTIPYQSLKKKLTEANVMLRLNGVSSLYTCVKLAEEGIGIAALPRLAISESIKAGRLKVLDTNFKLDPLDFSVAYLDGPFTPSLNSLSKIAIDITREHLQNN